MCAHVVNILASYTTTFNTLYCNIVIIVWHNVKLYIYLGLDTYPVLYKNVLIANFYLKHACEVTNKVISKNFHKFHKFLFLVCVSLQQTSGFSYFLLYTAFTCIYGACIADQVCESFQCIFIDSSSHFITK